MSRLLIVVTLVVALIGCGGGGGGGGGGASNGLKITGEISGNGYAVQNFLERLIDLFIPSAIAVGGNIPDAILVIYDSGNQHKFFPLSSSGYFSIDISSMNRSDLVAFLVNQTTMQFFCNIKLPAGAHDLNILMSNYIRTDIKLGKVDSINGCLTNSTIYNTGGFFPADLQQLQNIARSDDPAILYFNKLSNPKIESYISARFKMGAVSTVLSQYNQLTSNFKSDYYFGSYPLFYINESIGSGFSSVDLYPPSTVGYGSSSLGPAGGYSNMVNSTTPINKSGLVFNSSVGLTTVEMPIVESYPEGKWILKNHADNTTLGEFQFAGGNVFDSNNYFKGVIPKIKLDVGGVATVKYYRQLSDGSYEQVDRAFLDLMGRNIIFSYVLNGTTTSVNFVESSYGLTDQQVGYSSPTSININNVARLIYSYEMGGVKYQFSFE